MEHLKRVIREVPDFPKPGINFYDITTLLSRPQAMTEVADALAGRFKDKKIDIVAAIESRGFIFGSLVAERLGAGFAPIRKPGKLPYKTISECYSLEYGKDAVEMHIDAVSAGQRVLVVDDLLATGGTMAAACRLIEKLGGVVAGCSVVIELGGLGGREKLSGRHVTALINYAPVAQ